MLAMDVSAPSHAAARVRQSLGSTREVGLENLAIAAREAPEGAGGNARCAAKGANEIRKIRKPNVQSDVRNGAFWIDEQPRSPAQSRAHQVLMGRYAERAGKQAQEMERAQTSF